jgi:hypothetical protein
VVSPSKQPVWRGQLSVRERWRETKEERKWGESKKESEKKSRG